MGGHNTPSQDWGSSSLALPMVSEPYESHVLQCFRACFACPTCSCPVWLSPSGKLVAQEPLLRSSCLRQGYLKAPHGAHRTCPFSGIRLALYVFLEIPSVRESSLMESMMTGLAKNQRFPVAGCHQLLPESFSFRYIFHLSYVVDLKWSCCGFTIFTLLFVQPFDNLRTTERPYVNIG